MIPYIICVILSYFLGCINPAYVLAKRKGKNILAIGSHNPGASNTMLNFGWAAGILVGACDILKACIAVFLCKTFFPALPYIGYIAGISCIMGHMYNVFLHFKGGKGLASLMGMMLILDCFVLAAAAIVYRNIEASLFGLIAMYASAQVMDGILYGLENGKLVHIVSTQNDEITKDIIAHLNRSATILKGRGAYSGTEMDVIMVVVRKTEFFKLKTLVHSHDPNAFIVVTEAGEIIGEGWKPIDKEN